eukprot:CAMPEP_0175421028 /NCGR_PEP_ID=MMETSP0095-20121207/47040_1 /TAXON_ID=311494 /ORGANISM="Alexandrium monilatum, Strain CCMP3105" /LENGTH=204 /DNA_ID=CAMNT_0016720251 /DNA_START=31 /DNA_END=645 /DNA_ORIENTATION=-
MDDPAGEPLLLYRDPITGHRLLSTAAAGGALQLIFLDVDGVLNRKDFTQSGDFESDALLPECLAELHACLQALPGNRIVLSSTWRSDRELRDAVVAALERLRPGCVVGQTQQHRTFRNDVRSWEVAAFLAMPEVAAAMRRPGSAWCAVDDMDLLRQAQALVLKPEFREVKRILPALQQCFVKTAKADGLDASGGTAIMRALAPA